ncbi:TetR family transcriptional regulator [Nocardia puris]|nr:TetR family transcriptional regulator [Nocardia puris]MBF6213320.1 TetR family transcriptional regulator [Nocardia puris]MBF6369512.1 TetR family transcriptional regulator [Nocardia puris]MBF6462199.1 TetR family transcriptional regulator [Nocardia puris]
MSTAPLSLRDRKKQRTRRAIADAALRLFAERGYDAVTVADVAAAAEVGTRTLHRYYSAKEELLFAEDDELRAELAELLAARPRDETVEATLGAVVGPLTARFADHLDALRVRDAIIAAHPALRARDLAKRAAIEELLAAHLASRTGGDRRDVGARLWAKVGLAVFFAGYETWLERGGDLAARVLEARTALLDGLAAG